MTENSKLQFPINIPRWEMLFHSRLGLQEALLLCAKMILHCGLMAQWNSLKLTTWSQENIHTIKERKGVKTRATF